MQKKSDKYGKILIVDDDREVLRAARIFLKRHFRRVDVESKPTLIPDLLAKNQYDVVLLDMNFTRESLSGKEGFSWLQRILEIDADVAVILITAYGDVEKAVQAIKRGAADFIQKPWDNQKLLATIVSAIKKRQSTLENLVIRSAEIQLQGKVFQLLALQDIHSELQQKELDAWQNLTSVLRHEIMNTVTPIAALSNALMEIVREDAVGKNGLYSLPAESYEDLSEGLAVIQKRTQGLVRFVDAYRSYTKLPKPVFSKVSVLSLFEKTHSLLSPLLARQGVEWKQNIFPKNIELIADEGLLEIVLINLVRNAIDALRKAKDPQIILTAKLDHYGRMLIQVADNGSGVEEELKTKVFIPFFTSKESGSGIGLSLCRQILQLHNGVITLENAQNPTVFSIRI